MRPFARIISVGVAASLVFGQTAAAFCGFYVATSDSPLINKASRVVLAHQDDTTLVTMASDVVGDAKQFGLVIPVPTVIKKEQVKIIRAETVQHLVDYTKPRLVEYHDPDPCAPVMTYLPASPAPSPVLAPAPMAQARGSTVRIEEQYSVEEYDIIVLTATVPADLVTWLNEHGYRMPPGAEPVIGSYLRQGMHFFLAKVNLEKMKNNPTEFLRPIQVTYKSAKFMLPIRLGTVNANGPQDMIVLALTRGGRIETTNYPTVKMPTGAPIPLFVQARFGEFYDAVLARQVASHEATTFLEYAWNMGACDPCSSPPLSNAELRSLGASWVPGDGWQQPAFVTRLHVRYDRDRFPEDLALHETGDNEPFQARYVMRHPFTGDISCMDGYAYRRGLPRRFAEEADSLRKLTGWDAGMIHTRMNETGQAFP
jgi:hypothetical protein